VSNPRKRQNSRYHLPANTQPSQNGSSQNERLQAALRYAESGKPVFPLHSVDNRGVCSCGGPEVNPKCKPGKHPRTRRGHLDVTTDKAQIRRWWVRWPDANIGIPTGKRSGLLALDVDTYNWGAGSLETLEDEHSELPETAAFQTGRGGMQLVFQCPPDGPPIRNSAGQLGRGLDVRGEGGYIVVPPSRTEGPYEWLERRPPVAPPEWLLEALRERPGGSEGASDSRSTVSTTLDGPPIPDGERNDTLASIAGRLHDGSRSLEQLAADLMAINAARCVAKDGRTPAPLPEPEVIGIAHSIHRTEPCKPAPELDEETLEAVAALFTGILERLEWKGRSGPMNRAVYTALLITARQYGQRVRSGVKVSISVRTLALAAGTTHRTVLKALKRLERARLVYRTSRGQGTNSGALVLRIPQNFTTQPRGGIVQIVVNA
jgi:DNA-binding transcriptional ArsR family regulator